MLVPLVSSAWCTALASRQEWLYMHNAKEDGIEGHTHSHNHLQHCHKLRLFCSDVRHIFSKLEMASRDGAAKKKPRAGTPHFSFDNLKSSVLEPH